MRAARSFNKGQPEARVFSAASHTMPPHLKFSLIWIMTRSRRPTSWNSLHRFAYGEVGPDRPEGETSQVA